MGVVLIARRMDGAAIEALIRGPAGQPRGWLSTLLRPIPSSRLPDGEEADEGDLDKAWQAVHHVLTGTAEGGDPPLGYLLVGGTKLPGLLYSEATPRALTPDEVKSFAAALEPIDEAWFRERYDPEAMRRDRVYLAKMLVERAEEGFDYVFGNFEQFRSFVATAAAADQGIVIGVG